MNRIVAVLALALSLSTSVSAFAAPAGAPAAARHEGKSKHDKSKNDKSKNDKNKEDKKFPMKAEEFRKHVSERVAHARGRLEKHISQKKMDEAKANVLRARFNLAVAVLDKKVDHVCADGTVTREEAKQVRELAQNLVEQHKKDQK